MSDVTELNRRIDAEFTAADDRIKAFQTEQVQAYEGRQERMERLHDVFHHLRGVWRPRLEALVKKFGDKVQVTPVLRPSMREATFEFQSSLAQIDLRFAAKTDPDVRTVILSYDLDILPILMKFDAHEETEFPLDAVDYDAAGQWIDDRIIDFVKTYLALHENTYYQKSAMVEDPIAGVRFPKFAAACKLERDGKTYYFIGEETRQAFEQQK
ncbi:hypothetical protein GC163_08780 [bacterium]|nr:hypothetical protein [bacterium]